MSDEQLEANRARAIIVSLARLASNTIRLASSVICSGQVKQIAETAAAAALLGGGGGGVSSY